MLKALLHHLRMFFSGTGGYETEWARRNSLSTEPGDWNETDPDWVSGYWRSAEHPHRAFIIDAIAGLDPASVLEIGSNCGPNLRMLAKRLPESRLVGIDINREAVEKGNAWLKAGGISNANLMAGYADDLRRFPDNAFDVVFTDAVLIYFGPDKIRTVLREMVRVAKKGIVLLEWQKNTVDFPDPSGIRHYVFRRGLWAWNYPGILRAFKKAAQISCVKLPPGVWPDPFWERYGVLVLVQMRDTECTGGDQ